MLFSAGTTWGSFEVVRLLRKAPRDNFKLRCQEVGILAITALRNGVCRFFSGRVLISHCAFLGLPFGFFPVGAAFDHGKQRHHLSL